MASAEIPPESDQTPSAHRLRSNSYDRAMSEAGTEVKQPPPPANLPKLTSTNNHPDNDIYLVKWIEFNHERLPILLQNINGPCPLLALANILLLRKRVKFGWKEMKQFFNILRFLFLLIPVLFPQTMSSLRLQTIFFK